MWARRMLLLFAIVVQLGNIMHLLRFAVACSPSTSGVQSTTGQGNEDIKIFNVTFEWTQGYVYLADIFLLKNTAM